MTGDSSSQPVLSANEANPLYVPLNRLAFRKDVRIYCVLDGAQFDDLQGMLAERNLSARSLYRNDAGIEMKSVGPWLVDPYRLADGRDEEDDEDDDGYGTAVLPDNDVEDGERELSFEELEDQADLLAARMKEALEAGDETGAGLLPPENSDPDDPRPFAKPVYPWPQVRAVLEIVEEKPAAIFWIGDASLKEPVLHRHLRTINKVLIPADYGEDGDLGDTFTHAANGRDNAFEGDTTDTHEAVQFRHPDGNVLAEVMPVLNDAQFSRLFGPARLLVFTAPDHPAADGSVLYEAPLPDDSPAPRPGFMRLTSQQMKAIESARVALLKKRLAEALKADSVEDLGEVSDEEIARSVERSWLTARELGINSIEQRRKWAWLDLASGGSMAMNKSIREHLNRSNADRNWDLQNLVALAKQRLKETGGTP